MSDKKYFKPLKVRDHEECELCGAIEELRPYGKNGEWICYECGKKNPETTEKMMKTSIEMMFNTQSVSIAPGIKIIDCT